MTKQTLTDNKTWRNNKSIGIYKIYHLWQNKLLTIIRVEESNRSIVFKRYILVTKQTLTIIRLQCFQYSEF